MIRMIVVIQCYFMLKFKINEIYLTEILKYNRKITFDTFFPTIPKEFILDTNYESTIHYESACKGPCLLKYEYKYKQYKRNNM